MKKFEYLRNQAENLVPYNKAFQNFLKLIEINQINQLNSRKVAHLGKMVSKNKQIIFKS